MARFDLNGKTVVITGASGGIGAETALAFARRGAKLALSGRNRELLRQTRERVQAAGAEAWVVPADVTKPEEVKDLVAKATELTGRLDVMVLGAGIGAVGEASRMPAEDFRKLMEVNFWGVLHGFYAALPHFIKQGFGQFIIINSLSGKIAMPMSSNYCASKFALRGFAEAAQIELKGKNIDLISVYPSFVDTPFQNRVMTQDYTVPKGLSKSWFGDRPEKIAGLIVNASAHRKPEVICTLYGNFGARFLPMSDILSWLFEQQAYTFARRILRPKRATERSGT